MKISVIYSVYDRRDYVLRSLHYLTRQTLPPDDWEIVIVDDGSPGDYLQDLRPWKGRFNIQYAKIDVLDHPVLQQLNPNNKPLLPPYNKPLRFHTPALSHNIAFRLARGDVLFITQPDVIHNDRNLERAVHLCKQKKYFFGRLWLSGPKFRDNILGHPIHNINNYTFPELLRLPEAKKKTFRRSENYWYVSAVEKKAVEVIGGVDENYLGGVFAEDDNFRMRIQLAGWPTQFTEDMAGIHIDHSQLNGRHDRDGNRWKWGAQRNRKMWKDWCNSDSKKVLANIGRTWGDLRYVKHHEVWDR